MQMAKNKNSEGGAPSQRQLRVGELIRRTISDALNRGDIHDPELNRLSITVGEVRTSSDLKIATAYVLPLGGKNGAEAIAGLKRNKHELRRLIGKVTALKYTPDLRFRLDEPFDRMDETTRLFSLSNVQQDIDKPATPDEDTLD
jgi:ribosome-binding factor A